MSWQGRLREAAYTSPSGVRKTFLFEDVRRTVERKTAAFDFPGADGTYVQDLGNTGRRYPLRLFFWGGDYDLEASAFEDLLLERGEGTLEHPAYGQVKVVPFGTVTRRDDLKTAGNQAVIEVTFWETTGIVYPLGQTDPAAQVVQSVDAFNAAMASDTADGLSVDTAIERVTILNKYSSLLDQASAGLAPIAAATESVQTTFNTIEASINAGLDVLISDPLTLAFQTSILLQAPARARALFSDRINAYRNLANNIFGLTPADGNDLRIDDLYSSSYVTGAVVSAVHNEFPSAPAALSAAEELLDLLQSVVEWRDNGFAVTGELDTGGAYQQLQQTVALAAGFLIEISFTLKRERRSILDRQRTIIDLVAELYGSVDEHLDFFITSNDLAGDEYVELQRGRSIVYYV